MKNRISELRMSKGMSQESLGRVVNMSQQMISKTEKDVGGARVDSLIAIAGALDVTVDYLLGLTDYRRFIEADMGLKNEDESLAKTLEYLCKLDTENLGIVMRLAENLYTVQKVYEERLNRLKQIEKSQNQ